MVHQLRSLMVTGRSASSRSPACQGRAGPTLAAAAVAGLGAEGAAVVVVPLEPRRGPLAVTDVVLARLPGGGLSTSLPEALWEAYDGRRCSCCSRTWTASRGWRTSSTS